MKLTPAKVTMLMLVAVGGLIGMYVVKGLFAVAKPVQGPKTVILPMATAHLAVGTLITDMHIGNGPAFENSLLEDHLRSSRVVVGRIVKKAILPGTPIRGSELYEPGENVPLEVSEGKQAVSVSVKESSELVDGLIRPGDHIDVYFRLDASRASGVDERLARLGGVSMTLFKGVKVLAINKRFRQAELLPTGNTVTLELTAAQTNILLVAQPSGAISFSYNPDGEGDGQVALSNVDRVTLWDILGLKKRVRVPKEEPDLPFVTETYRGASGNPLRWNKDGKKFEEPAPPADPRNDNDNFSPADVFVSPGLPSNDVPSPNDATDAAADPDIPMSQPGNTGSGVRSRVGSMLRARPKSADNSVGPTASRN